MAFCRTAGWQCAARYTINDLAMAGAIPLYLSLAFIIEEGLSREDLMRVLNLVQAMPREAEPQTSLDDH